MADILSEIDELNELDHLRETARSLRDAGIKAVSSFEYGPDEIWEKPGDRVERALLLRVLFYAKMRGIETGEIEKKNREIWLNDPKEGINTITLSDRLAPKEEGGEPEDRVPLLRSARALQALLVTPGKRFSVIFICLYRIIKEISYAGPTEWLFGGARAGKAAPSSAFITGECVRGIIALKKGLEYSSRICKAIASFEKSESLLNREFHSEPLKAWGEQDRKRMTLTLEIEMKKHLSGAVFPKGSYDEIMGENGIFNENIRSCIDRCLGAFRHDVAEALDHFNPVIEEIDKERKQEAGTLKSEEFDKTESAHRRARWVLVEICQGSLKKISGLLDDETWHGNPPEESWKKLGELLDHWAGKMKDELRGPELYMETVITAELARASGNNKSFNVCQLAFAAASYAELKDIKPPDRDDRLERAAKLIGDSVDEDGGIRVGHPVLTDIRGYVLLPIPSEIIQVFGDLLRRVSAPVKPDLVRRLIRHFQKTQHDMEISGAVGFGFEEQRHRPKPIWWITALAVLALHRIARMLDSCINERLQTFFNAKKEEKPKVDLNSFFYPDYGLAAYPKTDREPLAELMGQFHAHLKRVTFQGHSTYSAILYGPPGTGKTTLLEALAATAGMPLFEITPSDILVGGEEMVEQRARAVFKALGMLSDAVILFDEFDPLVRKRDPEAGIPQGIFEFLTPGMLTKLKNLHDRAKKQRVVYCLATNLIGTLDPAVTREGRFDRKVGFYPPDLLSRAGRLVFAMDGTAHLNAKQLDSMAECIGRTKGGGMARLGLPGWFSLVKHGARPDKGTLQHYIKAEEKNAEKPRFPTPEKPWPSKPENHSKDSIQEWQEWGWIEAWDNKILSPATWGKLMSALEAGENLALPSENSEDGS